VEESFRGVAMNRFSYLINKLETAMTTAENMKVVVGRKKTKKHCICLTNTDVVPGKSARS
jgi:hypothetical protein